MPSVKKFFRSFWILITKPGILSVEYKKGNKAAYANPLAMYVVVTAIFFALFYNGFRNQRVSFGALKGKQIVRNGTIELLKEGYKNAKTKQDSLNIEKTMRALQDSARADNEKEKDDDDGIGSGMADFYDTTYGSIRAYDSIQQLLPPDQKDNWFTKMGNRRDIVLSQRYRANGEFVWVEVVNKFLQYFPYMVFILLPLFILFLKLLYVRKKRFRFIDHSVFFVHIATLLFLFMSVFLGFVALKELTNTNRLVFTAIVILLGVGLYTLKAMRRFYEQNRAKTFFKFMLFSLLGLVSLFAAFILYFSISITWS